MSFSVLSLRSILTVTIMFPGSGRHWLDTVQQRLHQHSWLLEYDFIIPFRYKMFLYVCRRSARVRSSLEQFEDVVKSHLLVVDTKKEMIPLNKHIFLLIINTDTKYFVFVFKTYRSFHRIIKMDFDDHLELSPACLLHFIRWLRNNSVRIGITVVQFKMYFLNETRIVLIRVRLHEHSPLMCVPIFFPFLSKIFRNVAHHYRLHN
jgi:hypothetical protein